MSARAYMSSPGNDAIVIGCTEVLFQPSFSLCCVRNMRRLTRWLRYGVAEQSTMRITKPDTAQSERALVRLVDTVILDGRLYPKSMLHTIHEMIVSSSVVFSRVPRTLTWSTFVFTVRALKLNFQSTPATSTLKRRSPALLNIERLRRWSRYEVLAERYRRQRCSQCRGKKGCWTKATHEHQHTQAPSVKTRGTSRVHEDGRKQNHAYVRTNHVE